MIMLLDLSEKFNDIGNKVSAFLEKNGSNPLFWSITLIVLFAIAYWAIQYLNKK